MSLSLYEIDQRLLALVDPETGEIQNMDDLQELQIAREEKLENVACWVKNLDAEAKAIREEEKALAERRHSAENKIKRLKQYLADALNGEKFSTARCAVSFRRSSALNVLDVGAAANALVELGREDLVSYQMPTIDKAAVKQLVAAGAEVPGVEITENISVGVR